MNRELNEAEIKEIKEWAREKLGRFRKGNDIIGTQVFSILSIHARIIRYPLGEEAPWGFTRMSGSVNDTLLEKPFVAINSSISPDCQVFAAAHELYHIWYEQNPDYLPSDLIKAKNQEISEKRANRFAAEFLVDEQLLKQETELYGIQKQSIKSILQLAALFTVPYRTMVKRLHETGMIDEKSAEDFLAEDEASIEKYKRRYSIRTEKADGEIVLDNLVELAVDSYEKELITYEKLEYLLEMNNLTPEELGIIKESPYAFPDEKELERIMEENE